MNDGVFFLFITCEHPSLLSLETFNPLFPKLQNSIVPVRIPLPEGMTLRLIKAGGRHSAAITDCNRMLAWGWNEEGQLAHGTEKDSFLPRPSKIPTRIKGAACQPVDLALGMCHTVVVFKNTQAPVEIAAISEVPEAESEPIVEVNVEVGDEGEPQPEDFSPKPIPTLAPAVTDVAVAEACEDVVEELVLAMLRDLAELTRKEVFLFARYVLLIRFLSCVFL